MTARRLAAALSAGATSAAAYAVGRALPDSSRRPWARTNHAGRPVTLLEGPAHVVGLAAGAWIGGAGVAPVIAALGAGALGALDDLTGDTGAKGLRGHLRAARAGRVTTGLVKVVGLGALGVVVAWAQDGQRGEARNARAPHASHRAGGTRGLVERTGDALLGGAVVAGTANLVNLFDLRPGRALKVAVIIGAPMALAGGAGATAAAAAVGACVGSSPADLRGEAMLGDTGANALGAVLGSALIAPRSRTRRVIALAVVSGLTLLSERVSFTSIIESTPGLRALDAWGRPRR